VNDTLSIFYKHFTPEVLIDALQKHVNQNIRAKTVPGLYKDLSEFLGEKSDESWDLDEDDFTLFSLTRKGAMNLLIKAGYLKVLSA
jgi:hypothetical protein